MASSLIEQFEDRIVETCLAQFPRTCGTCGREYATFKEWVESTSPVGAPMPDDDDDEVEDPIGLISFVNCPCGSTLVLKCEDPSGEAHRAFNEALREEMRRTGRSQKEILCELRERIRNRAKNVLG